MKEQDQIRAIAELDGLQERQSTDHNAFAWFDGEEQMTPYLNQDWRKPCPRNYLQSYDAILPLIQKQTKENMERFLDFTFELYYEKTQATKPNQCVTVLELTPSQLCEALLRATGKWIE